MGAQPFERRIDPFPVLDEEGVPYAHPFLGGLNAPRPQFVDLDGDGDLDLFVQDVAEGLMFFENVGTPAAPRYVWRTDHYQGLAVGQWYRFADLDGDGDLDLLAEQPLSRVRYYRNDGTPRQAAFTPAADTLGAYYVDGQGVPRDTLLFIDRQNVPALADLDCDGWHDLFVATIASGTLIFYQGTGVDSRGAPRFRFVTDRYQGIEIIGASGKREPPPRLQHGANALTFIDLDRDGDLDLFWGDFFSPSLYYIENRSVENTGTCGEPGLQLTSEVFPLEDPLQTSGYNAPFFADIDGDNDPDLFVGVLGGAFSASRNLAHNFYHYENEGDLQFTLRTTRFLSMIDGGDESVPALADLDGDGDLDLVVGNKINPLDPQSAQLFFFENEGTAQAPRFRLVDADYLAVGEGFNYAPAFADIDGDGALDLFVGRFDGAVMFYRNDGTPTSPRFVLADPAYVKIPRGSHSTPAFADIDGDGDLDLFVGEASGEINFYRNVGTSTDAAFVLETERFGGIDVGARSRPAFYDLDGDGDLDLLVGTERQGLVCYRNTGTAAEPVFVPDPLLTEPLPGLTAPAPADVDGDGAADLWIGTAGGGLLFYENRRLRTDRDEQPLPLPARLAGSFPNPFRTATLVRFHLPAPAPVRLSVHDVLGRTVRVLLDEALPAGAHEARFEAGDLPAGLYLYTLSVEDRLTLHGTMTRVK